jgi:hypothetical protein
VIVTKKKKTEPVCDCNYLAYVIANQELCVVARKPDFVCVVEKATWLFGI